MRYPIVSVPVSSASDRTLLNQQNRSMSAPYRMRPSFEAYRSHIPVPYICPSCILSYSLIDHHLHMDTCSVID